MAASTLSALLGFGREIIFAHYYGTRSEMDAFVNASTTTVIFGVFNGAVVAALVPIFSDYVSRGQGDEVRRLGSTVMNVLFFAMTGLAILGCLIAPMFVSVIAHGFPAPEQDLVVSMVRWLMPGIVATSLGGVCAALLNANQRFLASSLIWVAANLVTIWIVIALHREFGIFALVLGTLLGLFAQVLIQIPSILRHRLYRFELDLRHPGLMAIGAMLVPVAVGSGAGQINLAFDRYFASTLTAGSTAGMGYTTKLVFLPVLIIAAAIGTVIFPLIAGQFASSNRAGIRHSISLALRMVSFIVIPCAAGLSVLAFPIVQTLFERGAFGPDSTALCTSLVPFACIPLIAISYSTVLGRACYACKEVRLASVGSIITVAINIGLSAAWLKTLGARGLLLANGVSALIFVVFLVVVLWRLIGGFEWKPIVSSLTRVVVASIVMAGSLFWIFPLGSVPTTTGGRALHLAGLLVVGGVVFVSAARVLGIEELTIAVRTLAKKLSRPAIDPPQPPASQAHEALDVAPNKEVQC